MKTLIRLLTGIAGLFVPAAALCAATVDVEKEKAAVIAVIEEERDAYLALDDARMAATWIQRPTSTKVYVFDGKETRYDGYAAIAAHDRKNLVRERARGERPRTQFEFSNHRVTLQGDSAWLTCNARWEGIADGVPAVGTQARVYVLQKENRRWKLTLMSIAQLTFERKGAAGADEQELIRLEAVWTEGLRKADATSIDRLLADEYRCTNDSGMITNKAQDLATLRSGDIKFTSLVSDECHVRVYGDTAVVTGRNTERSTFMGTDTSGQYRWTDTWVKRDGRWQCVATHYSKVAQK